MKNQENLTLLRTYMTDDTVRHQYAVEELNRQLEKGLISRDDFLHDLGFATVDGKDEGCDAAGLAESAAKTFPTAAVAKAMAEYEGHVAFNAVRMNSPELFDLVGDAEQIVNGYVEGCSALPAQKMKVKGHGGKTHGTLRSAIQ